MQFWRVSHNNYLFLQLACNSTCYFWNNMRCNFVHNSDTYCIHSCFGSFPLRSSNSFVKKLPDSQVFCNTWIITINQPMSKISAVHTTHSNLALSEQGWWHLWGVSSISSLETSLMLGELTYSIHPCSYIVRWDLPQNYFLSLDRRGIIYSPHSPVDFWTWHASQVDL